MLLESADPHGSDVLREKNRTVGKFLKNALFLVYDVTMLHRVISYAKTGGCPPIFLLLRMI